MKIKKLSSIQLEEIIDCFLDSFEGYFVEFPKNYSYYKERWKASKVNFDFSYGMFDEDKLVGFIINCIDERGEELVAYNGGTGVIPDYRGQKIVKQLYDYALSDFTKLKINKCLLEVIKENHIAVKAYEGIGFKIVKEFKCFKGALNEQEAHNFEISEVSFSDVDWDTIPNQRHYSWDNHYRSLEQGNNAYYYIKREGVVQSFFVSSNSNDYILQWECLIDSEENWRDLFGAIASMKKLVKINNVDESLINKLNQLTKAGFLCTIEQFEMELVLGN